MEQELLNYPYPKGIGVFGLGISYKFRTYSIDVSEAEYINKLSFTVTNSDYETNYYLDNMRFY